MSFQACEASLRQSSVRVSASCLVLGPKSLEFHPGGEAEDKHGWMKEVCDVVNDSIPEVRTFGL